MKSVRGFLLLSFLYASQVLIRCHLPVLTRQELQIDPRCNMCLVINTCITIFTLQNLSLYYIRNLSTSVVDISGYICVM